MVSLFCRHNRFTADCPICSRGTVLDRDATAPRREARRAPAEAGSGGARPTVARPGGRPTAATRGAVSVRGPSASVGPFERDGQCYEVRLEKVPGGLRLAEWSGGRLRPAAPTLGAGDLAQLVRGSVARDVVEGDERQALARALESHGAAPAALGAPGPPPAANASEAGRFGASPGRSGELRDELRVERLDQGRLRVARWVLRPGTGWDLLDAPTMLPAGRYAEALGDAARKGLLEA